MTSPEQMKQLAQQYATHITNRNYDAALAMLDEGVIDHMLPDGMKQSKEGVHQLYEMLHGAFPDFAISLHKISADGDMLVLHEEYTGTSSAPILGLPATGKKFQTYAVEVFKVKDGKFVERFYWCDFMKMQREIA